MSIPPGTDTEKSSMGGGGGGGGTLIKWNSPINSTGNEARSRLGVVPLH